MNNKDIRSIAVAKGDGIGPEIMDEVINIFNELDVPLKYHFVEMGKEVFLQGHVLGMTPEAKAVIENLGILFKGPMETPKGGGNRSINVIARKMWATYANCRRFRTLPGVDTIFSKANVPIDLTIIRENLEDTYSGMEHMLTQDIAVSRKFTTAYGSYQIHRYAFNFAKQNHIKQVTCAHKANIMKMTDGMFLDIFYDVAKEYPEIHADDVIVDDMCMKLVTIPDQFKVIVLPNLQGDIVSDLCAGLVGGLGFAPSANVGSHISIFEAVHGTAPDIAGKNLANPTALLMSGIMMLNALGLGLESKKIESALLKTLKEGIHTADLKTDTSPVSTHEFAQAIIKNVQSMDQDYSIESGESIMINATVSNNYSPKSVQIECVGVDIFIDSKKDLNTLLKEIPPALSSMPFSLEMISNRGANVYPNGSKFIECVDSYTIRLMTTETMIEAQILDCIQRLSQKFSITSIEILKKFDNKLGFSII